MKVFITGISSGIGYALTKQLIAGGYEVWGIARRLDKLLELQAEVGKDRLRISQCDVRNLELCKTVAGQMREAGFIPDVVILNAGVFIPDIRGTFLFDIHRQQFKINVDGVLFWVAEFMPDFLNRKSGMFVAVSSTAALRPSGSSSYSASKAAISMAFRQLRMSFANSGIRFSTVHFGPIDTQLWPGRRMFLIPPADVAATFLAKIIEKDSNSYFYPFITTSLLRLTLLLPDRFFRWVTRFLKYE